MPKIETFLKTDEIDDVEEYAKEYTLSRSAYVRAAVIFTLRHKGFLQWLEDNVEKFK